MRDATVLAAAAATAAAVAGLLYLRRLHRDLAELRGQLQKVEHMDRRRRGSNAGTAVQKSIVHTDQGLHTATSACQAVNTLSEGLTVRLPIAGSVLF